LRAFLGIPLPAEVIDALAGPRAQLKASGVKAAWARPEGLHVTLRFLGSVNDAQLRTLTAFLAPRVAQAKAFLCRVRGLGAFPGPRRPGVVWAGVHAEGDLLQALHGKCEAAAGAAGLAPEARAFHPHATLCRVKDPRNPGNLPELLTSLKDCDAGAFIVDRVVLFESRLGPGGSRYAVVETFPLAP
jgi:2'-5' RNA ligase